MDKNTEGKAKEAPKCRYESGVQCDGGYCKTCGWNPAVEARRKAKIRKEFGYGKTDL